MIFYSCEQRILINETKDIIVCSSPNFVVSENDNIVIPDATTPVLWKGNYTNNSVQIGFTLGLGVDNETETFNFIFDKVDDCLKINRGYEYYYGSFVGVSALTEVDILELQVNEWIVDKKLTGNIVYRDHHDKKVYNRNFWVEFTEEDYKTETTDFNFFPECFSSKLPIFIDIDKDGITDYKIIAEQQTNSGNKPSFTAYTIKLIAVDETINQILSPTGIKPPFPVIFEPPFTSNNTRKYDANRFNSVDVKNALDVFYEFEAPYENYNFFLNNNLTYKKQFLNNIDDYYLIRLIRNDNYFYGWIKIDFNALNCNLDIVDTFLNTNANQHVKVD